MIGIIIDYPKGQRQQKAPSKGKLEKMYRKVHDDNVILAGMNNDRALILEQIFNKASTLIEDNPLEVAATKPFRSFLSDLMNLTVQFKNYAGDKPKKEPEKEPDGA